MEESGDSYSRKEVSGHFPESGAIFMSNRSTFKECLDKGLLGLPGPFSSFVRSVKAGMILFLFEFEERKLYGVFEAISDGGMNIVPHAYISSGRKFPAQVKFTTIWHCDPLCEDEFRDAIRDNYFNAYKFNFGLSEDQIRSLLWLFDLKKLEIPKPLRHNKKKSRMLDYETMEAGLKKGRFTEIQISKDVRWKAECGDLDHDISEPDVESIHFDDDDAYDPEHPGFHHSEGSGSHSSVCHESYELLSLQHKEENSLQHKEENSLQHKEGNSHIPAEESEDYIPLLSPDHSDSEEEELELGWFVGNQVSSIPVPQFAHRHILNDKGSNEMKMERPYASTHGTPRNGLDDSSNSAPPLSDARDSKSGDGNSHSKSVHSNGMYSDKSKTRASVFSRLNFSSQNTASENQNDTRGRLVYDVLSVKHGNHQECKRIKSVTQKKYENGDPYMDKRMSVFLRLTRTSDAVVQPEHCMTELKEGTSQWMKGKEKVSFQNANIIACEQIFEPILGNTGFRI